MPQPDRIETIFSSEANLVLSDRLLWVTVASSKTPHLHGPMSLPVLV